LKEYAKTINTTGLVAALNLLAEQLDHQPDDLHEAHMKVRVMINELRATVMNVPEDLIVFEKELTERVEGGGDV
jgi:hypothetical protein